VTLVNFGYSAYILLFLARQTFKLFGFLPNVLALSVPDEGYSRDTPYALH